MNRKSKKKKKPQRKQVFATEVNCTTQFCTEHKKICRVSECVCERGKNERETEKGERKGGRDREEMEEERDRDLVI